MVRSDACTTLWRNKLNARALCKADHLATIGRMQELCEEDSAAGGNHRVLMRWSIVLTVLFCLLQYM